MLGVFLYQCLTDLLLKQTLQYFLNFHKISAFPKNAVFKCAFSTQVELEYIFLFAICRLQAEREYRRLIFAFLYSVLIILKYQAKINQHKNLIQICAPHYPRFNLPNPQFAPSHDQTILRENRLCAASIFYSDFLKFLCGLANHNLSLSTLEALHGTQLKPLACTGN